MKLVAALTTFASPYFLKNVLDLIANPTNNYMAEGLTYVFGMFGGIVMFGILDGQSVCYFVNLSAK